MLLRYPVLALAFSNGVVLASIQILNLLVEPVRHGLGLSDVEISLLQGFAFGVSAALVGIPIARIADRGWRRNVVLAGASVWSIGTVLCGLAQSFSLMFIGRAFVGIGEVFFLPAAISLLEDIVPRESAAAALGVFVSGSTIGSAFAWLGGGWFISNWASVARSFPDFAHIEAWRAAFLAFAALGVASVLLVLFVREPPAEPRGPDSSYVADLKRDLELIKKEGGVLPSVIGGVVVLGFGGSAIFMWLPSVFVRAFALSYADVGNLLGASFLVFCSIGAWSSGVATDWLRARGRRDAPILILLAASVCCAISLVAMVSQRSFGTAALSALACLLLFVTMASVMGPFAIAEIAPPQVRSQALAVQYFFMYLVPIGIAPSAVAALTTYVFRRESDVGWAIAIIFVSATIASCAIFLRCRKAYARQAARTALLLPDEIEAGVRAATSN